MAKILTTTGVSACIERIINESTHRITIVCPYVDINERFKDLIAARDRNGVELWLLYGKRDLSEKTSSWVRTLKNAKQFYLEHLHAKCYSNESEAILTSMNLYAYSEHNNYELGVLVRKAIDSELFSELNKEVDRLIELASSSTRPKAIVEEKKSRPKTNNPKLHETGYCIRCGIKIGLDGHKPHCPPHHASWAKWGNPDFEEGFCHKCGCEAKSSKREPLCTDCGGTAKPLSIIDKGLNRLFGR